MRKIKFGFLFTLLGIATMTFGNNNVNDSLALLSRKIDQQKRYVFHVEICHNGHAIAHQTGFYLKGKPGLYTPFHGFLLQKQMGNISDYSVNVYSDNSKKALNKNPLKVLFVNEEKDLVIVESHRGSSKDGLEIAPYLHDANVLNIKANLGDELILLEAVARAEPNHRFSYQVNTQQEKFNSYKPYLSNCYMHVDWDQFGDSLITPSPNAPAFQISGANLANGMSGSPILDKKSLQFLGYYILGSGNPLSCMYSPDVALIFDDLGFIPAHLNLDKMVSLHNSLKNIETKLKSSCEFGCPVQQSEEEPKDDVGTPLKNLKEFDKIKGRSNQLKSIPMLYNLLDQIKADDKAEALHQLRTIRKNDSNVKDDNDGKYGSRLTIYFMLAMECYLREKYDNKKSVELKCDTEVMDRLYSKLISYEQFGAINKDYRKEINYWHRQGLNLVKEVRDFIELVSYDKFCDSTYAAISKAFDSENYCEVIRLTSNSSGLTDNCHNKENIYSFYCQARGKIQYTIDSILGKCSQYFNQGKIKCAMDQLEKVKMLKCIGLNKMAEKNINIMDSLCKAEYNKRNIDYTIANINHRIAIITKENEPLLNYSRIYSDEIAQKNDKVEVPIRFGGSESNKYFMNIFYDHLPLGEYKFDGTNVDLHVITSTLEQILADSIIAKVVDNVTIDLDGFADGTPYLGKFKGDGGKYDSDTVECVYENERGRIVKKAFKELRSGGPYDKNYALAFLRISYVKETIEDTLKGKVSRQIAFNRTAHVFNESKRGPQFRKVNGLITLSINQNSNILLAPDDENCEDQISN
jgi:hypothetical protein